MKMFCESLNWYWYYNFHGLQCLFIGKFVASLKQSKSKNYQFAATFERVFIKIWAGQYNLKASVSTKKKHQSLITVINKLRQKAITLDKVQGQTAVVIQSSKGFHSFLIDNCSINCIAIGILLKKPYNFPDTKYWLF